MDIRSPILRALRTHALCGYEIARFLRNSDPAWLAAGEGLIYPALQMLEIGKWVRADWRRSPKGRKRRYYSLTPKGRKWAARPAPTD